MGGKWLEIAFSFAVQVEALSEVDRNTDTLFRWGSSELPLCQSLASKTKHKLLRIKDTMFQVRNEVLAKDLKLHYFRVFESLN